MLKSKKYTSILAIVFITVVLLLLLVISAFFISVFNIYKNSSDEFEERYFTQAVNAVEMVVNQIDQGLEDSLRNVFFTNYTTFPRAQYLEDLNGAISDTDKVSLYEYLKAKSLMQSSLNDLKFSNDYLNTVYFYDGKNELFYTDDNRQFSRISFPDTGATSYIQKLENEQTGTYLFDIRTDKEMNSNKTILSIVYLNKNHEYNYYLIANLDTERLSEDIFSGLYGVNDGNIYVVNDDGDIILSNNINYIGDNIEKIENEALKIKKNTGEWKIELSDNDLKVMTQSTDMFGWYVVTVNRNEGLNRDIRQLRINIGITAFIALLISVFAAVMITKKLFKPIHNITEKIEKNDPNIRSTDEFKEILDFIDKNSNLQDNLALSLPMYKEKVLEWKLNGQNLKPENKSFICQILDIDDDNDNILIIAAAGDWQKRTLQDKITNIVSNEIDCTVLSINSYMVYVGHDTDKNMKASIDRISQKVSAIDDDIWVGVGEIVGFDDCAQSYQQAIFSIGVLKTRKKTGLITYKETLEENIGFIDIMNDNKQKALEQAIKLRNFDQAKIIYSDALEGIKEYIPTLSTFQIRNEISAFNMCIFKCMNDYMPNNELSILHYKILSEMISEDLDVIKVNANKIIDLLKSLSVNPKKYDLYDDYVEQAKAIIDIEYSNDVSLINTADRLGITPEYLSKLFKDREKVGFVDYLTKRRMEKAKELLVSLNYSISKTANMVGFQNSEYFSRVFKKHFGIPPGKYRHQAKLLNDYKPKNIKN